MGAFSLIVVINLLNRSNMSNSKDLQLISLKYFTPLENDIYKCSCGKILKQKKGTGWTNLMAHIRSQHDVTGDSKQNTLSFMHSKKTETIHGWIEWICMELKPFAFVESEYTRKYSKLEKISRHTLEKYMHLLSVKVEQEIARSYCAKLIVNVFILIVYIQRIELSD